MVQITAREVKALRDRTGLPMMDCKRALEQAQGDADAAIELLRKAGRKTMEKRAGRETAFGRIGLMVDWPAEVGAMVELRCESAPVASNEGFVQLAADLARQLATGPGAETPEELLGQPSPSRAGQTLQEQFDELNNQIREVFRLARVARIDGTCGGYVHHNGNVGVLVEVEGGSAELAKDICMHIAAMRPMALSKEDLDPDLVDRERQILKEAALKEGKPEKIVEKIVEGRLRNFYAERCLLEQPFVKDDKQTVGKVAAAGGMKILRFIHWEIGKE
ncbi:MAG TPA: translation elongation factor Ts [Planctomycetaceae bacterium]|nr:translation elongation factor Ts [Planctomycetaceae bacterium]HIQ21403.1 translation elongation factor Ts [Planctomycetota bacterium]